MSAPINPVKVDDPEFKWGKKSCLRGNNKDALFYDSFTFDGVDYSLYDCVYIYKQGVPAPYIGKLIKMWETADGINKIKVQWFFRPSEISYYLKDAKVLENELFFASGDGKGLANTNPLETIAGKCNVVCTSMDKRNPQPSAEELQMADYVFYRIFDVKTCTISDQMDDKVGGLEVNFLFNRREGVRTLDSPKLDYGEKYEASNVVACNGTLNIAGNSSSQQLNNMKLDKNVNQARKEKDTNVGQVSANQGSLVGKHSSSIDAISSRNKEILGNTERNTVGAKNIKSNTCEKKDKFKDLKSHVSEVQAEKGTKKYARESYDVDCIPSKRTKIDGSFSSDSNDAGGLSVPRNDVAHLSSGATTSKGKLKSGFVEYSIGYRKNVKDRFECSCTDEKLSKTDFCSCTEASRSGHAGNVVGLQKNSKSNGNLNALSKTKVLSSAEKENLGSAHKKDSFVSEKNKKFREKLSETNVPSTTTALPNQTPKSVSNNEFKRSGQSQKPTQSLPTSMKKMLGISAQESEEKSNLGHEQFLEKERISNNNSCPKDEGFLEKAKLDHSIEGLGVNKDKIKHLEDNNFLCATKNSPEFATSCENIEKSRPSVRHSNEYHNSRDDKLLNDNLSNSFASKYKDTGKVGKIIDVTPRPPDKPTWMKFSWDELMKTAHDHGRLVLLQNLDPEFTSGEVEDILWHTFGESCNARIVPHTAISNPYSGQAFAVFKSRSAANKVVQKLDDECLMLPNQRPLVACHAVLPMSLEKQVFVGHFVIDKGRRQIQKNMKEALSTSHFSQSNTIEFAMGMDWCLLQLQSDIWWETLHKIQLKELQKLGENLKQ